MAVIRKQNGVLTAAQIKSILLRHYRYRLSAIANAPVPSDGRTVICSSARRPFPSGGGGSAASGVPL
jgi:hypothetical protein